MTPTWEARLLVLLRSMTDNDLHLYRDALALDMARADTTPETTKFCADRLRAVDNVLCEREGSHEPGCDLHVGGTRCSCSPWKEP